MVVPEVLSDLPITDSSLESLIPFAIVFVVVNTIGLELVGWASCIVSVFGAVDR